MKKITISNFFDTLSRKMISSFFTKDSVSRLGFFIPSCSYLNFGFQNVKFLICFLSFSSQIYAQFANVNPPFGGFAIDGGLRANTPTSPSPFAANQGDWYPGTGGTGLSVFDASGNPLSPGTAQTSGRVDTEEPFGSNDDIFTNGSKFNDYVSALRWFDNSAPDKNDIDNALYHVSRDSGNNQWIFISGDRKSTNGTSYIDFELLQGEVLQNSDGTFTGNPLTSKPNGGGRTKDDIIISMEYTNGGTKPNVYIYQWMLSGTKWSYELVTLVDLGANAFAETNRAGTELNVPYSAFGSNNYQQYAFVEAAVNVTYLLNQVLGGASCSGLTIKTLWVKTKASAAPTAALKDFITPISVDFNFGSTEITEIGPFCADDTTAYLLSADPSGGTFSGSGVSGSGPYYFTPSAAGGASSPHTINYISADGSCTGSIEIVVNALPTISGTLNVCVGFTTQLTGSGTPALSNAWMSATPSVATVSTTGLVSGVSAGTSIITYTDINGCQKTATVTVNALPTISGTLSVCVGLTTQLTGSGTPALSNAWMSATPSVATVSAVGLVTGVSAGTSIITYTDINGCQKTATVTVIANPSPPSVSYTAPTCDQTTFSITLSGVINGATYTILDKEGNAISGIVGLTTATTYTGTAVSPVVFSNIPAGSGYQVSVSVNGCGSGLSSCGVVSALKITETAVSKEASTNREAPKSGFEAYPVPFKDQLTIKYNFDYVSNVIIEVFNAQGIRILSKTDTNSYLNKEITLDLHANKAKEQMYIVKLTTDRESSTKKVLSSQ
ncbi:Ig-like domain-containing protein [Flavobacterium acetivorans]|uniref:Ig-like domain-containing protein n=1 Tax=Flavobacterium acetivorans TaxID=2893883 RepID=UPI001E5D477A|nr:Ig-like domain-containing protein [Flavobacterium sp. F-29]UFH35384.1 Ig-like domain-containing protein [Flavobacterium sp. F-29]